MNVSRHIFQGIRKIATTAPRQAGEIPEGYQKLKVTQAKFQVNDGKPVHLKGGTMDSIMYRATMGLSLVGLAGIIKVIFDLSYK